jgi:lysophospholipase L1-like esterase
MITLQKISDLIKSKGKYWIAFTGDSITSCEWVHPNWREIVEYVLQEELTKFLNGDWKTSEWGIKTFNFAYDGATTKDILERVDNIQLVKPDLVISLMGGNDREFNIDIQEHIENVKKIIEKLQTKIVWCTSTPSGESSKKNIEYEPYAKALMEIPENENLQLIDMFNIYKKFPLEKFFTFKSEENPVEGISQGEPDLTHPNQLGNAYIAKVILKEVFSIDFNPEQYIEDTLKGEKYPNY